MTDRQTGKTTEQIKSAPPGALFIWCNDRPAYARDLARHLGRSDLQIRPLTSKTPDTLHGMRRSQIVLDHAALDCLFETRQDRLYKDLILTLSHLRE